MFDKVPKIMIAELKDRIIATCIVWLYSFILQHLSEELRLQKLIIRLAA